MSREWQLKVFPDIWHAVRVRLGHTDCFVEFCVYPILGISDDDASITFHHQTHGSDEDDIDKAYWSLRGDVKWDGCMNIESNHECMVHACGPDSLRDISEALAHVYSLAKEIMPNATW